jgi:hypothetical protein
MPAWQIEAVEEYAPVFDEFMKLVGEFKRLRDAGDTAAALAVLDRMEPLKKRIAELDAEYGVGERRPWRPS